MNALFSLLISALSILHPASVGAANGTATTPRATATNTNGGAILAATAAHPGAIVSKPAKPCNTNGGAIL